MNQSLNTLSLVFLAAALAASAAQTPAGSAANPARTLEQIRSYWAVAPEELRRGAEAGQAEFQYKLGQWEWQAAFAECGLAVKQWAMKGVANRNPLTPLSPGERQAAETEWSAAREAEARKAGEAGERGAQSFISRLDSGRAMERGRRAFEWFKKAADSPMLPPNTRSPRVISAEPAGPSFPQILRPV